MAAKLLRIRICVAILAACILSTGCTLGPRQIDAGRMKYNEAIQRTVQEEMLLNLVRLKYRETPEFVVVGGVAAQYSFEGSAGIGADIKEAAPDILGINGAVSRSEKPTITYAPQRDERFSLGLISPIGIDTLALVARTGWSWERILRVTVQSMNLVDNATSAGGPTPERKPAFEDFHELTHQLRALQKRRGVEIARAKREVRKRVPIPLEQLDGDFVLGAFEKGYKFEQGSQGLFLVEDEKYAALVLDPHVLNSPELQRIVSLLNLSPGRHSYEIKVAQEGQIQPAYTVETLTVKPLPPVDGQLSTLSFNPKQREDITISTRSILEMMFYLSHGIQVPEEHLQCGLVTLTTDEFGQPFDWNEMTGDLFRVCVSKHRPKCAAVATQHKGYWYYIDDRDLNSQSTFAFMLELFSIKIRGGAGAGAPLLTLGIGG